MCRKTAGVEVYYKTPSIEIKRLTQIKERIMTDETKKRLSPGEKAAQNPKNTRLAIEAFCYHGCHAEESTNSHKTKLAIKKCTETGCLLWPHRGWQSMTGGTCKPR